MLKSHLPWILGALAGLVGLGYQGWTLPEVSRRITALEASVATITQNQKEQGETLTAIRCAVRPADCLRR